MYNSFWGNDDILNLTKKKTQKKLLKFLTFSRIFQGVKIFLVWQIRWCFFVNLKKKKMLQRIIASWIFEKNTIQETKRLTIKQTFWTKNNILSLSISHHFMILSINFDDFNRFLSKIENFWKTDKLWKKIIIATKYENFSLTYIHQPTRTQIEQKLEHFKVVS